MPTLLWDILLGPQYDLRDPANRNKIVGWLRCGRIVGGHLGTPCGTFTRARDHPPGPPPLRSNVHVLGLPDLRPGDQIKVTEGNLYMKFSVQLLLLALTLVVPWTMENPATSRIWLCPQVLHVLRRRNVQLWTCEFCMFGTPWRKSTRFLGVHIRLDVLDGYRCLGAKRGLCRFSGCRHVPLAGQNSKGQWMTKIAEPYPPLLCKKLAQCFSNFWAQQRAEQFYAAVAR